MDAVLQVFLGHTRRAAGAMVVLVVLALGTAGAALADRAVNAADQAAAARDVLRASDLPPVTGWQKVSDKSTSNYSSFSCPGLNPKESDLITTGHASSTFETPGAVVGSDVSLLASADMVRLDWKRTFVPALVPCLRSLFAQSSNGKLRIVSARRLALPKLASYTSAYRFAYRVTVGGKQVKGILDMIALGGNRTEIGLFVLANLGVSGDQKAAAAAVTDVDQTLGRLLVNRALGTALPVA